MTPLDADEAFNCDLAICGVNLGGLRLDELPTELVFEDLREVCFIGGAGSVGLSPRLGDFVLDARTGDDGPLV